MSINSATVLCPLSEVGIVSDITTSHVRHGIAILGADDHVNDWGLRGNCWYR